MKPFMILSAANLLLFHARIIFPMHVEGEHFVCRAVGGSKVGLLLRMCSLPFPYHQCLIIFQHYAAVGPGLSSKGTYIVVHIGLIFDEHVP